MAYAIRFIVAIISVCIFSSSAMAIGVIDLDVTVYPNYGGSFSGLGDTTGTALYKFGISSTSPYGASITSLFFERDIFASIGTPFIISAPFGYAGLTVDSSDPSVTTVDGGPLLIGESLRFTVDYELTDTLAFFFGMDPNHIPPNWAWDLDGPEPWSQSVAAYYMGPSGFAIGGGSTSVPEPASIVLIGSGLIGLGLFRKNHSKKQ